MGWSAKIESNKYISNEEMIKVVQNLPNELCWSALFGEVDGDYTRYKYNGWGWSAATDIYEPEGKTLYIGGSYGLSGNVAEKMAKYIKDALENIGHKISVSFNW